MATHSSVLAWRIPGTVGAWWAAVYGIAQSRLRLKRLSSGSEISKNTSYVEATEPWIQYPALFLFETIVTESLDLNKSV